MGVFEQFPYTNFHELNLDWVIKEVKDIKSREDEIDGKVEETKTLAESASNSADSAEESAEQSRIYAESISNVVDDVATLEDDVESLGNRISANSQAIAVNSSRIDNISSLTEGSTTGDAELQDIRVGANSVVYPSAGDAVRYQIADTDSHVFSLENGSETDIYDSKALLGGYFDPSGNVVASPNYNHTLPLYVKGMNQLTYSGFTTNSLSIWLDSNKNFIRNFQPSLNGTYKLAVPPDVYYVAFTVHNSNVNTISVKGDKPITMNVESAINFRNEKNNPYIDGKFILDVSMFELGGISFSTSGWNYALNLKRVRTKQGLVISLKKGDVINVSTGFSFIIGLHRTNGTWGFSGIVSTPYTMNDDADVAFVIFKTTEENVTDITPYTEALTITRSSNAVDNTIMFKNNYDFAPIEIGNLTQGYCYLAYGSVVEDTNSNYLKTGYVEVKSGSSIILDRVSSVAYQYAILFDESYNPIYAIDAPDTAIAHSNIFINIPQNCKYIRFSIKTGQAADVGIRYADNNNFTGVTRHNAIISFIDDDTSSVEYVTRYFNALNNAGVKGNYAVQTMELTNQQGLKEQLLAYEERGFGMLYHCHSQIPAYNTSTRNIVAAESNFVQGLREMRNADFCDFNYWVSPYGVYDSEMQSMARRHGLKCLVSAANWAYNLPEYTDKYVIKRCDLGETDSGTHTMADLKALIDEAKSKNAWIIVTTHFNTWADSSNDSRLTEVAQYAIAQGLTPMTFPEAFSYYENALSMYQTLK